MRTPNLFIVGAPKCGTTSLYNYLRQHPDVFMPSKKEPHYFGSDLDAPRFVRVWETYCAFFAGATDEAIVGEASIWYLYSRNAATEIYSFSPDAKIIIMLRNPVDQMHSMHNQRLFAGLETIRDFEGALAAEADRKKGRRIPPNAHPVEGFFYRDVAAYACQVERYYRTFPRSNIHVILFDDLRADTLGVFRAVCEFLDIDTGFVPDLEVHNPSKTTRFQRTMNHVRRPPAALRLIVRRIIPSRHLRSLQKALLRLLATEKAREAVPTDLRRRLIVEFEPDIRRLEAIIERDLSAWTLKP